MIKYFCDACGKEAKRLYPIEYPKFMTRPCTEWSVDSKCVPVIGVMEVSNVCATCCGKIMSATYSTLVSIQRENTTKDQ